MRIADALLLVLVTTGFLAGCGSTPPRLEVTDAYVAQPGEAGSVVNVVVKASNPTSEPLAMWAIAYDTDAGESVGRWTQATAPAGGSVEFELPVIVSGAAAGSALNLRGSVSYVPGGRFRELLNELGWPLPSTSFAGSVSVNDQARAGAARRPGEVRTAQVTDPGPQRAIDTLPPLNQDAR